MDHIDIQIIGADDEEKYKSCHFADKYIIGQNLYKDDIVIHATLIRKEYDDYKYLLHPVIRKRLDNKLNKQKYICLIGKSCTGKSSIAKYIESNLDNSIWIDIDKIIHKSHLDENTKKEIIHLVGNDILDENNNIDRKKLGVKVFNDFEIKEKVYKKTWEYVDNHIQKNFKKHYEYIILDWYNIDAKKYWKLATFKLLTCRDESKRIKAVLKRDNITLKYLKQREKDAKNYNLLDFDYKIDLNEKEELDMIIEQMKN